MLYARHSFKNKSRKSWFLLLSIYWIQPLIKLKCVYQTFAFLFEIYWLVQKILFSLYSSAAGVWTTILWHVRPVPYPLSYSDTVLQFWCVECKARFQNKSRKSKFFLQCIYQIQSLIKLECVYSTCLPNFCILILDLLMISLKTSL